MKAVSGLTTTYPDPMAPEAEIAAESTEGEEGNKEAQNYSKIRLSVNAVKFHPKIYPK